MVYYRLRACPTDTRRRAHSRKANKGRCIEPQATRALLPPRGTLGAQHDVRLASETIDAHGTEQRKLC